MKIKFVASLPDILSAISLSGVPDSGARVKLDIPASDIGAIILLQQKGAGRLLKVTVEIMDGKAITPIADDVDGVLASLRDDE